LLNKVVILQHDNASPHRARQTVEKIEEMGWELLQHAPYLAPSNFHLFEPLKESLGGVKFENNEDVQQMNLFHFFISFPFVSTVSKGSRQRPTLQASADL